MLIISFAWTTDVLLSGNKSCTRRHWSEGYARQFRCGMECQGWDRGPRIGGRQVAVVRLMADPYLQRTSMMTEMDYAAEGLKWMEEQGMTIRGMEPREFWEQWKAADELVYVVRFQLVSRVDI